MAMAISILILAIGLISLYTLPVEQYPDIAPPTVMVQATYTGADAEAVMNAVIMPSSLAFLMILSSTSVKLDT